MPMPLIDLTGKRFGRLEVIGRTEAARGEKPKWHCRCDCGATCIVLGSGLKKGTSSCGCLHAAREPAPVGRRFGSWTVVGQPETRGTRNLWLCRCACGTERPVDRAHLVRGASSSCGCASAAKTIARSTTHGGSKNPAFGNWIAMRRRCHDPQFRSYDEYGAIGITVCDEWRGSFAAFIADMGERPSPKHTIDRIDPSLGYFKGNCRWATPSEQSANRRSVLQFTIDGETKVLAEWCRHFGVPYSRAYMKLRQGCPITAALGVEA